MKVYKSKAAPGVNYVVSNVGASRYCEVRYGGKLVYSATSHPIKVRKFMASVEAFIGEYADLIDAAYHMNELAESRVNSFHSKLWKARAEAV